MSTSSVKSAKSLSLTKSSIIDDDEVMYLRDMRPSKKAQKRKDQPSLPRRLVPKVVRKVKSIVQYDGKLRGKDVGVKQKYRFLTETNIVWKPLVPSMAPGEIKVSLILAEDNNRPMEIASLAFRPGCVVEVSLTSMLPLPDDLVDNPYSIKITPSSNLGIDLGHLLISINIENRSGPVISNDQPIMISSNDCDLLSSGDLFYVIKSTGSQFDTNIKNIRDKVKEWSDASSGILSELFGDYTGVDSMVLMKSTAHSDISNMAILEAIIQGGFPLSSENFSYLCEMRMRIRNSNYRMFLVNSLNSLGITNIYAIEFGFDNISPR